MKRLFAAFALLLWSLPVHAQDVVAPVPGIEATISSQMEAFLDRDVDAAFDYASPMIKGLFRNAQNFGAMVEQGYPMVWTPADVSFGDLRQENGALYQKVVVTDAGGRVHVLDYKMIETENGWRIDGVQVLRADAFAA
ncbi:protein of unknown function [Roseivivax lentus]|uniref:DUF4864 domain-containing protein n=1 Tax=Roseivivax lentus TaxID=633194 RepID=A0A1N7MCT8_9RHOB|nr:DUF4864 domain-containing protein [Roseivivax lentus]SIS83955.1 protein of unknown function [Roseivivax lentus]